jgi:glycosyltransferase involved in cell wall biosynthesis
MRTIGKGWMSVSQLLDRDEVGTKNPRGGTVHRFIVAQLGARMHYAVARCLWRAGLLERMFTDAVRPKWMSRDPWRKLVRKIPIPELQRFAGREVAGVPPEMVTCLPWLALTYSLEKAMLLKRGNPTATYLRINPRFCRSVIRSSFGDANAVYAFNSSALELFEYARKLGMFIVLEQTSAPRRVEEDLQRPERALWPDWTARQIDDALAGVFAEREYREWALADRIVCGSEFVENGIRQAGGPVKRCRVVPYGVDPPPAVPSRRRGHGSNKHLNVLFCGAVALRKGAPYVHAIASRLPRDRFTFRMVGQVELPERALRELQSCVEVTGAVPRSQVGKHFAWADVFLFPAICEGSATVCYEALGWGLPVITTPNAGSVVRHGLDGFVTAARDSDAMQGYLELLLSDDAALEYYAHNARERASQFTVERYGKRLLMALDAQGLHQN